MVALPPSCVEKKERYAPLSSPLIGCRAGRFETRPLDWPLQPARRFAVCVADGGAGERLLLALANIPF